MLVSPLDWFLVSRLSLLPNPIAVLLHVSTSQASTALRKVLESHCPLGSGCRACALGSEPACLPFRLWWRACPILLQLQPPSLLCSAHAHVTGLPGRPSPSWPWGSRSTAQSGSTPSLCGADLLLWPQCLQRGFEFWGPRWEEPWILFLPFQASGRSFEERAPFTKPQETTPDFKISVLHLQTSRYHWSLNQERIFPSFWESVISSFPLFPDTHTSGAREALTKEVWL